MSLTEINLGNLTSCWEKQVYDPRLTDYKHRLYPDLQGSYTPLGEYFTYLFDFQRSKVIYLSRSFHSILGYKTREIPSDGLHFFESIIHPNDRTATFHAYQKIWLYLNQLPMELRPQFKASLDFRIKKKDHNYLRIMQEMCQFATDNKGNVVYSAGRCVDISHWGKQKEVSLIMENLNHVQRFQIPSYRDKIQAFLSNREKEVLKLLACGLSSKAVADDLDISYHTVNTHRQNMLNKLGMRKTAGLINFAISNGII